MNIYMAINAIIEMIGLEGTQAERDELWSILNAYGDECMELGWKAAKDD